MLLKGDVIIHFTREMVGDFLMDPNRKTEVT